MVFGFPNGDTILTKAPAEDYHMMVRAAGREYAIRNYGPVKVRPMDKKDHYVKRCVAVAGDTLQIIDGRVHIDSVPQEVWEGVQSTYSVVTNGQKINPKNLDNLGMNTGELWFNSEMPGYPSMPLTAGMLEQVRAYSNVVSADENLDVYPPDYPDSYLTIFPFAEQFRWTRDNYGPIWVPQKGASVELNQDNLPLYERIIRDYEGNDLDVRDGVIFINGKESDSYTFSQDYYFMMGDNRNDSWDSRYWEHTFVEKEDIIGKAVFSYFPHPRVLE